MIAFENRNGLLYSYDARTKESRDYGSAEEAREHLLATGKTPLYFAPDGAWKLASHAGDESRKSDMRHSFATSTKTGTMEPGPKSPWKPFPVEWVADGESIESRIRAGE
jgi:hypothetical protein